MKNFNSIKGLIILSILFSFTNSFAKEVCKIEVNVYKAKFSPIPKDDKNFMPKRVAAFLKTNDLSHDCIDLRSLTSSQNTKPKENIFMIKDETIGFLTNKKPTNEQLAALKKSLCKDAGPACKVTTPYSCAKSEDLKFEHDFLSNKGDGADGMGAKVAAIEKFPKFSKACETGVYQDSWNDTASTESSKKLIKESGLVLDKIRSIEMKNKGKNFWSFGFPKHEQKPDASKQQQRSAETKKEETPGTL